MGIQALGIAYPDRIGTLDLSGNNLSEISGSTIAKAFPKIWSINLRDNKIRDINKALLVRDGYCEIDLRGNPLAPIIIRHPERYNNVTVVIDKQIKIPQFKQKTVNKILKWKRAAIAQGRLIGASAGIFGVASSILFSPIVGIFSTVMAWGLGCMYNLTDEQFDKKLTMIFCLGEAAVALGTSAYMVRELMDMQRERVPHSLKIVTKNEDGSVAQEAVYLSDYTYNLFGKN